MTGMLKVVNAFREHLAELDGKTAALLCYLDLKTNRPLDYCEMYLQEKASRIEQEGGFLESAFWLWVLGEYVNAGGRQPVFDRYAASIRRAVEEIQRGWMEPRPHWLFPDRRGVFLSNIAICYGGIWSANNHLREESLQQLLKEFREFIFAKLLHQGSVVSMLGSREILGDIGVSAVPFGLLNAGDLVLVASVQRLEEELVEHGVRFSVFDTRYGGCARPDLTALLAWYYTERGDLARAGWLLDAVRKQWERDGKLLEVDPASSLVPLYYRYDSQLYGPPKESELACILYQIVQANLQQKQRPASHESGAVQWEHRPGGSRSPYIREMVERFPRDPENGDAVIVRMKTEPMLPSQEAVVQVVENGEDWEAAADIPMERCVSEAGEKYWQAELGSFAYGRRVRYRFVVWDGQQRSVSDPYEFRVRGWRPLLPAGVQERENRIRLFFHPIEGLETSGIRPCAEFAVKGNRTIGLRFDFSRKEAAADAAPASSGVFRLPVGGGELHVHAEEGHFQLVDHRGQTIASSYGSGGAAPFEVLTDGSGAVHKLRLNLRLAPDERMYGTGERYTDVEFTGSSVDHYVFNQYRDQGLKTYLPVPLAISSKGYGLFLHTALYSVFRFGSRLSDWFEAEMDVLPDRSGTDIYLFSGTPSEVLQAYTDVTGKPKLPPKWAFGPWMSSNNWDRQDVTLKQVEMTVQHRIPATVLVLEQWSDEATFYMFNDCQYEPKSGLEAHRVEDFRFPEWGRWPDPKGMVEQIHKHGIRVLLWQIPVIKFMEGIAHAQRDEDERTALEHGLVVRKTNGEPYRIPSFEWFKDSLVPDFTNPLTRKWWFDKRRYLIEDIGVDGFKTDGGECIYGDDVVFHDGRTGAEMRNLYPNEYVGAYYNFAQELTGGDAVTFSRAGYSGAQHFPMHWAGDERSTFAAFRRSIIAGITSGMSGIPFWGWDLAGFHGDIPTAELYVRSAQMAAFCPVMQYHAESKGEFNQDRTPWNIAERTGKPWVLTLYKKFADLRMNLLPYIYDQAIKTSRTGIPLMRAMALEYPQDAKCSRLKEQYMFGSALLVAPVAEEGRTVKDVYLPEGSWISLFNGEVLEGGRMHRVQAAIEDIPVYQREDSVVAWNLADDYGLPSEVGNRVDGYVNLTFILYVKNRIEDTFEDDLGNRIQIQAERLQSEIRIRFSGQCAVPVTAVIRDGSGVEAVIDDQSRELQLVDSVIGLQIGQCAVRGRDVYVKAAPSLGQWTIRLKESFG